MSVTPNNVKYDLRSQSLPLDYLREALHSKKIDGSNDTLGCFL